jgi:hypothetical protein
MDFLSRLRCVDPTIVLGKQRRDHGADVVGQTGTTERRHVRDALVEFGVIANHAAEIGGDDARSDIPGMMMRVRPDEIITIRRSSLMSGRSCVRKNTLLK